MVQDRSSGTNERSSMMDQIRETQSEETQEPTVEELEMEWWQPLSCGCEPASDE